MAYAWNSGNDFAANVPDDMRFEEAARAARNSEERFHSLATSIPVGVFETDATGNCRYVNARWQTITGLDLARSANRGWLQAVYSVDRPGTLVAWENALYLAVDFRHEFRVMTPDGALCWVQAQATPIRDVDGVVTGYVGTLLDITEQRSLQEALEEANRAKSQFLARMSHELRTPLNAILGFSDTLNARTFGDLNVKQERYVNNILKSGRHLLQLVDNVLDLSQVGAGYMELELTTFDVEAAIEDVCTVVRGLAAKKNVRVCIAAAPNLPHIHADSARFKQVLFNLLSNAVKFTPEHHAVTISALVRSHQQVLEISVIDQGIGIKLEDQGRIFQEFEQVDNSFSRQDQGIGVGLAMSKHLVELHGGEIRVHSGGEYLGSTFTFTLPASRLVSQPEGLQGSLRSSSSVPFLRFSDPLPDLSDNIPSATVEEATGRPTVLVVEDNVQTAELLTEYLEGAGYAVALARSGAEAVYLAHEFCPIAMTLNLLLPGKSGWTVLNELQNDPATVDVPILLTSLTPDGDLAFRHGGVECLVKPEDCDRLVGVLEFACRAESRPSRVLVVDDTPATTTLLTETLSQRGFEILPAFGSDVVGPVVMSSIPDAIVLDLMLSDSSGFEMVHHLLERPEARDIPVLIYTANTITDEARTELRRSLHTILPRHGKYALLNDLDQISRGLRPGSLASSLAA